VFITGFKAQVEALARGGIELGQIGPAQEKNRNPCQQHQHRHNPDHINTSGKTTREFLSLKKEGDDTAAIALLARPHWRS
jgi:hypothetical protein